MKKMFDPQELKRIALVWQFEIVERLKSKSYWVTTVVISLLILFATAFPSIKQLINENKDLEKEAAKEAASSGKFVYCMSSDKSLLEDNSVSEFFGLFGAANAARSGGISAFGDEADEDEGTELDEAELPEIKQQPVDDEVLRSFPPFDKAIKLPDVESLKEGVESGEYNPGLIILDDGTLLFVDNDKVKTGVSMMEVVESYTQYQRLQIFDENNIDPVMAMSISNFQPPVYKKSLGKDQFMGTMAGIIGLAGVYFIIIVYGISVATAVSREKNDRTMELLITNTSTSSLIHGKVLAAIVTSVMQIAIFVLTGFGGMALFSELMSSDFSSISNILSRQAIVIYLLYAILGSILYFYLYAAVGALVTRVEEANQAVSPISFFMIAAYILTIRATENPHGGMMRFLSICPLTSLLAMFPRYTTTGIPKLDIVLSIVLLIVFTHLLALLSIKIYRLGSLNYGNKMSLLQAIKSILKENDKKA